MAEANCPCTPFPRKAQCQPPPVDTHTRLGRWNTRMLEPQLMQCCGWRHLQIEAHPHWRNDRVVHWCQKHGVHITAYSPMSSPGEMARKGNRVPNLLKVCHKGDDRPTGWTFGTFDLPCRHEWMSTPVL